MRAHHTFVYKFDEICAWPYPRPRMATFLKAQGDCIKAKLLQRLDTKVLTDEDLEEVIKHTGLDKDQIRQWLRNFRNRYGSRTAGEIEAFLRNEEKVNYDTCF